MKEAFLKNLKDQSVVKISCSPYVVGRSKTANFIITQVSVSRNHCEIVRTHERWEIKDYSSSGTFVNEVLIGKGNSVSLHNGDPIRFGPPEGNLCWSFHCDNEDGLTESKPKSEKLVESKTGKKDLKNQNHEEKFTNEKETIKQLTKKLKQVQNALNDLEEKNSVLKELAETSKQPQLLENITDLMETEFQCTICSELFIIAITLSCSHTFCKHCINQWKRKQKTCPVCRKKITTETRSLVVDNYIEKMVETLSVELKERRQALINERNQCEPDNKKFKKNTKTSKHKTA